MSTPNPVLVAAAPSLISALQAVKQFIADMGQDPAKWALNFPGAELKLVGQLDLLLPGLLTAEGGALQTAINSKIDGGIASLQALSAPKPAA
jgi:hypothetical protein